MTFLVSSLSLVISFRGTEVLCRLAILPFDIHESPLAVLLASFTSVVTVLTCSDISSPTTSLPIIVLMLDRNVVISVPINLYNSRFL